VAGALGQLENVRGAIESRFTGAGEILATAYGLAEEMVGSLNQIVTILDEEKSRPALDALCATAEELLALPDAQAEQMIAISALADQSKRLAADIEAMSIALRYMRVFSVNLKIAAAGAPEFAGFADEMLANLVLVDRTLGQFDDQLAGLGRQIEHAQVAAREIVGGQRQDLASVAADLSAAAEIIVSHNRELSAYAAEITALMAKISANVAAALQALQIGDATRQRIEHVANGLVLAADLRMPARRAAHAVLQAQLADLAHAFGLEAPKAAKALISLSQDARSILTLKGQLAPSRSHAFLRTLERGVSSARTAVEGVHAACAQAASAGGAAARMAETMLANVDEVRAVRTEIKAMALNTSLRCSRMGPAGRPPNVIALELRVSADELESVAEDMVRDLGELAAQAGKLAALSDRGTSLDGALDNSVSAIRSAGDASDALLQDLQHQGERLTQAILSLGDGARYHLELQAGLMGACDMLGARQETCDGDFIEAREVLDAIFATYTMARERDIHRNLAPAPVAATAEIDDAHLDDALF
jgi:hypothetical protein